MKSIIDQVLDIKKALEDALDFNLIYARSEKLSKEDAFNLIAHAFHLNDCLKTLSEVTDRLRRLKI